MIFEKQTTSFHTIIPPLQHTVRATPYARTQRRKTISSRVNVNRIWFEFCKWQRNIRWKMERNERVRSNLLFHIFRYAFEHFRFAFYFTKQSFLMLCDSGSDSDSAMKQQCTFCVTVNSFISSNVFKWPFISSYLFYFFVSLNFISSEFFGSFSQVYINLYLWAGSYRIHSNRNTSRTTRPKGAQTNWHLFIFLPSLCVHERESGWCEQMSSFEFFTMWMMTRCDTTTYAYFHTNCEERRERKRHAGKWGKHTTSCVSMKHQ